MGRRSKLMQYAALFQIKPTCFFFWILKTLLQMSVMVKLWLLTSCWRLHAWVTNAFRWMNFEQIK